MITGQVGEFTEGAHGFTIECDLFPTAPDLLADVTAVVVHIIQPDGELSTGDNGRQLTVPACIFDVTGKIRFTVLEGDLPQGGVYTIKLEIDWSTGAHMVLSGDFSVREAT